MNREQLQSLASEWTRMAKNDIRKKVIDFMREVDATPSELAYHLAMSEGELQQITEGNGEITLTTFAKLLIATGNALEIKPIEETPIGDYANIPNERAFNCPTPRPNVFARPKCHTAHPLFDRPSFTREDDDDFFEDFDDEAPMPPIPPTHRHDEAKRMSHFDQPRDKYGRFAPRHTTEDTPRRTAPSPFEAMSNDKLINIIKERLWDSEIDTANATKDELVAFLNEKDKRMNQYKRMKELENDPKVNEFKERLKNTVDTNPHLREWVKKFIGEL